MKPIQVLLGAALASVLTGCASSPVVLGPVGPNPARAATVNATGQLEVYSALQTRRDGNEYDPDPVWHQHTDYTVYAADGKRVKHVFNTVGHYEEAPSVIALPAGRYVVVARAQGLLRVKVPVVIESGRTTRVHLDAEWKAPADTPNAELVEIPGGYAVGWRVDVAGKIGIN